MPKRRQRRRCRARRSNDGQPCKGWAVNGALVCRAHGGTAPQVRAKATERTGRAAAQREWSATFGRLDLASDVDPDDVVLTEIRWLRAHTDWLRARVVELEPDAVVWGLEREVTRRTGDRKAGVERIIVERFSSAKVNAWVALYGEVQDRLLRACAIAHRMGIEERQVELAERVGSAINSLMYGVLGDLDLTDEQWTAAHAAMPTRLRALAAQIGAGHAS